MHIKNLSTILFVQLLFPIICMGQWDTGDTLNLTLVAGGQVFFKYKSLNEIDNGITYTDWSTFNLYFDNENGGDVKLTFYSNTGFIFGEDEYKLSLDIIELQVNCPGCPGGSVVGGWHPLSDTPTDLINNLPGSDGGTTYIIDVSYRCGDKISTGGLLGDTSSYYYVDIIFDVDLE